MSVQNLLGSLLLFCVMQTVLAQNDSLKIAPMNPLIIANVPNIQLILDEYASNPIRINELSYEELLTVSIFTSKQAWGIKVYRMKYGPIRSVAELERVLGFGQKTTVFYEEYIDFSSNLNFEQHQLKLETNYGVRPWSAKKTIGSKNKFFQRIRYRYKKPNQTTISGLSMQKSPGEKYWVQNMPQTFSGFLMQKREIKKLKLELLVGDYKIRNGSGLLFGSLFNWFHPGYIKSSSFGFNLLTHSGSRNRNVQKGGAIHLKWKEIQLISGYSNKGIHGDFNNGQFEESSVTYINSKTALNRYRRINEELYFIGLGYSREALNYKCFANHLFAGMQKASAFEQQLQYRKDFYSLNIEHAYTKTKHAAILSFYGWNEEGIQGKVSFHSYDTEFNSKYSGAYSSSGKVDNEKSVMCLFRIPLKIGNLGFKSSYAYFPIPENNFAKEEWKQLWEIHWSRVTDKYDFRCYLRKRLSEHIKQIDEVENIEGSNQWSIQYERLVKNSLTIKIGSKAIRTVSGDFGFSEFHGIDYDFKKMNLQIQNGYYNCNAYEARTYHYRPGISRGFNVKMNYGVGGYLAGCVRYINDLMRMEVGFALEYRNRQSELSEYYKLVSVLNLSLQLKIKKSDT